MTHVIEALIPIKTGSGLNDRIHWRARARRAKQQRSTAWMVFARTDKPLPAVVTLVCRSFGRRQLAGSPQVGPRWCRRCLWDS
jgi:hypothetical protein